MARQASKKIRSSNASSLATLTYGFLLTSTIHLLLVFWVFRDKGLLATTRAAGRRWWWRLIKFVVSEGIALTLWGVLRGMAARGEDLAQQGLTGYMFDIIYITWFVHLTTALVSEKLWYTYLVIPIYASYIGYTKVLVPFALGGRDPLASLFAGRSSANGAGPAQGDQAEAAPAQSKRQAKLQKRAERGDARVQSKRR